MKVFFSSLFVLVSAILFAQPAVTYVTADQAVQALLGPGVSYSNAAFTGYDVQLGSMTNMTGPAFQITDGIVIGCSDAQDIVPNYFGTFLPTNISGDPDLLTVANSVPPLIGQSFSVGSVNNIAALEFDFVAVGTELNFNFIFGSDEYLTYVNTTYNDVFAFFLSGPGITGPYASPAGFPDGAVNIAIVPNSIPELPITISSVNNVLNAAYYQDNQGQANATIQLNGFTKKLTATHGLECGGTYHIKLAIANGSDQALKSDVIIEAGSFNIANNLIQSVAVTNPGISPIPGFPQNAILEGDNCYNGQFIITPPSCLADADTIQLLFSGDAQYGVDYSTNGVTQLILESGISDTLFLSGLVDNQVEGTNTITFGGVTYGYEMIEIGFVYTDIVTGEIDTANASMMIVDYDPVSLNQMADISNLCPGAVFISNVAQNLNGGVPNYQYQWEAVNGPALGTNSTQLFQSGMAGQYMVTVIDYCGTRDSSVFTLTEPPAISFAGPQDLCTGVESDVLVSGGLQPYSFDYNAGSISLNNLTNTFTGNTNDITAITVTDACNQSEIIPVILTICDTQEPNIITADNDGLNEAFIIKGLETFPNSQVRIFNRWGDMLYESYNYDNNHPWTPTDVEDGVYFWTLNRADGVNREGFIHVKRK